MTEREQRKAVTAADLLRIIRIFGVTTKKELVKYCRGLEITDRGLVALILHADLLGFCHIRAHWEWVPAHLEITDTFIKEIQESDNAERLHAFRKIGQVFSQRRLFTGHLFYTSEDWHLFFFDQHDRAEDRNHWKHGAHVHYLSHLVRPDLSLQRVIDEINTDRPKIKGEIHIRYRRLTHENLIRKRA